MALSSQAYQSAPFKIYIIHKDKSVNQNNVVFKWHHENQREGMFARSKYLLEHYRAKPIHKVLFYDKQDLSKVDPVGGRDEDGVYYGDMEFMNRLRAKS